MRNCIVCNSVIEGNRRGKIYCSNSCKQRAYYERKQGLRCTSPGIRPIGQFNSVKKQSSKLDGLTYLEYCYIISQYPASDSIDEQVETILAVFDHVYQYNEEITNAHQSGLLEFQRRLQELTTQSLDKGLNRT